MTKYIRIPGTFTGSDILIPADRIISIDDYTVNVAVDIRINGSAGFEVITMGFYEFNQDVSEYNMKSWLMKNVQRALVSNWQTNIFDATEPPCAIVALVAA